ncbi:beta-ketoacyl-ACP synthase [Pseudenhygromyxa sp. WMMC2535]|uniref:beta-ketoacyl-ACP synthase n=1 Tax=Pseudenhygromyxa sp. WMMC2535 TaxID=2712867 RepID=UPI0015537D00|nr:beta-ketoacyl-ACP synthase [Pseudenhygromyxa sp. WMMC2535]NVB42503.1 beta-ketoacyl-ACP synthase [Pseudenhygromyxa sp. WMMC2535]
MSEARRVVVTGMGLCSPIGNELDVVSEALQVGRGGIQAVPEWPARYKMNTGVAGLVEGVEPRLYPRRKVRTMGRVALLAAFASEQAVSDAGLVREQLADGRVGLAYGSTHGSSSETEAYCREVFAHDSLQGIAGSQFLKFMSHTCAANLAEFMGVRGRVLPTCSACTSGSQAIGAAYESIRYGMADVMIAGGAEEAHFIPAGIFDVMFAASSKFNATPEATPRPFDAARDGVVIGEGAGTLVLESYEHARARGARIHGELLGYATNCDGIHLTNPSWEGMAACMQLGLQAARVEASDVDYVNAHGTATELGDIAESRATAHVLGVHTPVSTQKSHTGHTLGACGALEAVFSLLMMQRGFIAANRNLERVDPRCAGLDYVRGDARGAKLDVVMSNNFAFGGINTSLVFRRV